MPPEAATSIAGPRTSTVERLTTDASEPASTRQPAGAELEPAKHEFIRLRTNVENAYETIGRNVHGLSASLQNNSKVLSSRALFRLVLYVAGKIEGVCHLEQGRLTSKLVRNTPFSRSLDDQVRALGRLREATETFCDAWDSMAGADIQSADAGQRKACLEKLEQVAQCNHELMRSATLVNADTERQEDYLKGLEALAMIVYGSLANCRGQLKSAGAPAVPSRTEGAELPATEALPPAVLEQSTDAWTPLQVADIFESLDTIGAALESRLALVDEPTTTPRQVAADASQTAEFQQTTTGETAGPSPETASEATPDKTKSSKSPVMTQEAKPSSGHKHVAMSKKTHWHSTVTTGRPAKANALFYREKQEGRLCMKHSVNAFMGGPFVGLDDIKHELSRIKIEQELDDIGRLGATRYAAMYQLDEKLVAEEPEQAADTVVRNLARIDSAFDPDAIIAKGSLLQWGCSVINQNKEHFNVPEAKLDSFVPGEPKQKILDFVQQKQEQSDRMVVGSGAHYVAFRKTGDGSWVLLDSMESKQIRKSPLEYIGHNLRRYDENRPVPVGLLCGVSLAEFMTFDTDADVSPTFPGGNVATPTPAFPVDPSATV